jgi:zinc protease
LGWANDTNLEGKTEEYLIKDLKVIIKQKTTNEIVSAQLYLRGGSLNLSEVTQGIEPLIFRSAILNDQKYAEESWEKILEGTGAQLGAASGRDFTLIGLRCTLQYFDQLWEVFSDYVMKNAFFDQVVEVSRDRMLTEIRGLEDSPDVYLRNIAEQQFYRKHPYRLDPNGTEQTIARITIEEMTKHLKDHLKKSRLLLVITGNVSFEDIRTKVENTFGRLSKGNYEPDFPAAVQHDSARVEIIERDVATNYILGLCSAPSLRDPDYYAMSVAIDILKWRLFEEIRTKRNLSYAPDAFLGGNLANYAGVYATSPEPDSTVNIILTEMRKLKENHIGAKDLRDRINMYLTYYYLNNEFNAAQGQFLAQYELAGISWQEGAKMVDHIREVTPEQVQRVANKYFKNIQFVYLGKPELVDRKLFTSM